MEVTKEAYIQAIDAGIKAWNKVVLPKYGKPACVETIVFILNTLIGDPK